MTQLSQCKKCATWGDTVEDCPSPVICPDCKRRTWPNLGVNLPAGCAVAISASSALTIARRIQKDESTPFELLAFKRMKRFYLRSR